MTGPRRSMEIERIESFRMRQPANRLFVFEREDGAPVRDLRSTQCREVFDCGFEIERGRKNSNCARCYIHGSKVFDTVPAAVSSTTVVYSRTYGTCDDRAGPHGRQYDGSPHERRPSR